MAISKTRGQSVVAEKCHHSRNEQESPLERKPGEKNTQEN